MPGENTMYSQPNYVLVTVLFIMASISFFLIGDEPASASLQDSSKRITDPIAVVVVAANKQVQASINTLAK